NEGRRPARSQKPSASRTSCSRFIGLLRGTEVVLPAVRPLWRRVGGGHEPTRASGWPLGPTCQGLLLAQHAAQRIFVGAGAAADGRQILAEVGLLWRLAEAEQNQFLQADPELPRQCGGPESFATAVPAEPVAHPRWVTTCQSEHALPEHLTVGSGHGPAPSPRSRWP